MNEWDLPLSPLFDKLILCCGAVAQLGERLTGSQKVRGSTPLSSTKQSSEANTNSKYLSICPNSQASLSVPLHRLIDQHGAEGIMELYIVEASGYRICMAGQG